MNQIIVDRIEKFIALSPEMVDAVLTKYGVSKDVPITVLTLVSGVQLFGEPFARDLYDAVYSSAPEAPKMEVFKSDSVDSSGDQTTANSFDWAAFWAGLTGLANASPDIINAANGNTYPYPNMNLPGYYPPPTTSSITILMYVSIAVAVVIAMIVVFKKA